MNAPLLPYSIEAEEAVLGSLLLDSDALGRVAFLDAGDFYREKHQWLFQAIQRLAAADTPPDPVTLVDELARMGRLDDVGGIAAISEIMLRVPTAIHAEHYGRIVERCAVLRRLVGAAEKVSKMAIQDNADLDLDELLTRAEAEIFAVGQRRANLHAPVLTHELSMPALDRYTNIKLGVQLPGVPTHSTEWNDLLVGGGFQPTCLYLIAARPAMGKSSLMGQLVLHQASKGYRVLVFSLEMGRHTIYDRLVANLAQVNLKRLQSGPLSDKEYERIGNAVGELGALSGEGETTRLGEIVICDQRGLSPFEMQGVIVRAIQKYGPINVVYVDHMQEVGERGIGRREYSRADVVSAQIRAIRNLAGLYHVPIVVLCQLNRQCESRQDKRPMLSDLKESGALEETADVVTFLYRDEVYNTNTTRPRIAELINAKQRNGPTGTVEQRFDRETGRWQDVDPFHAQREPDAERVYVPPWQLRDDVEIDF